MTILETFIKLRDDLKTWVTNNLNQKANISYVDDKFAAVPEFDPTEIQAAIDTKVDKVDGMGLSTNDYTTAEKDKLATIEPEANHYEHPVYASYSAGLYKVEVDNSGHVSSATLATKADIVALGIPAQDTTYETEISGLSDKIDETKEEINGNIEKVSERVTANESAIEKLNGDGEGSVKQSIDNAFNEFASNLSDDKVVNTYKELIDYAAEHGSEFTELVGTVDDIDEHVGRVENDLTNYKTDVSEQFAEVNQTIADHSNNTENPHGVTKAHVGLENVDNTSDFEKPISYATQIALDGKSDVGHAHDDLYYDKDETLGLITVGDIDDICALTQDSGGSLDPVTAATKYWVERFYQPKGDYLKAPDIDAHNVSTSSHNDLRILVEDLAASLRALSNSDDTTLDQMREVVDYIKNNKTLLDSITTSKVNVSDIINNLATNVSDKPLSAAQGVVLKALIDSIVVPTKVSELANDIGYLTEVQGLEGLATEEYVDNATSAVNARINALEADGSVTTAKIADGAVTTAKIAHYAIKSENLGGECVLNHHLAPNSVNTIQIMDEAISGDKITSYAINYDHLNDHLQTVADIAHEHSNNTVLDTYDKTQTELLAAAQGAAETNAKAYTEEYVDNAVAQKTQVQIITWEDDD